MKKITRRTNRKMDISDKRRNELVQKIIMSDLSNEDKSDIVKLILEEKNSVKVDFSKDLLTPRSEWSQQTNRKSITDC